VVVLAPAFYSALLAWSTVTLKLLSPGAADRSLPIEDVVSHMRNISRTLTLTFTVDEQQQQHRSSFSPQLPVIGGHHPSAMIAEWCNACDVFHSSCPMPSSQLRSSSLYPPMAHHISRTRRRLSSDDSDGGSESNDNESSSSSNSDRDVGSGVDDGAAIRRQYHRKVQRDGGGGGDDHDAHAPPPAPRHAGRVQGFRRNPAAHHQREAE
jgi:hypothetical protein